MRDDLTENLALYYFDANRRIYELNGVKKTSPFYECFFIPIEVVSENEKEFICKHGMIKKKNMQYSFGKSKFKVFTEDQKNDEVYINENRHIISHKILSISADKLRMIEDLIK